MCIQLFFWIIISWFAVFYLHEQCHALMCKYLGGKPKIKIWFYKKIIPSMCCTCDGASNYKAFLYAGGLGAAAISAVVMIPFYWLYSPVFIGLFIAATVNLFYGLFEGHYRIELEDDTYMKWHYVVEAFGVCLAVLILYFPCGWVDEVFVW